MLAFTLILVTSLMCHDVTYGYSLAVFGDNVKTAACVDMAPNHKVKAQTGASPYTLSITETHWVKNSQLTLTLASNNGSLFRGFIIQGRLSSEPNKPFGSFQAVASTKQNCDNTSLTHDSNSTKLNLTFQWNAPDVDVTGNISFVFTIVKQIDTFWIKQQSDAVPQFSLSTSSPSTTNTIPTTTRPCRSGGGGGGGTGDGSGGGGGGGAGGMRCGTGTATHEVMGLFTVASAVLLNLLL